MRNLTGDLKVFLLVALRETKSMCNLSNLSNFRYFGSVCVFDFCVRCTDMKERIRQPMNYIYHVVQTKFIVILCALHGTNKGSILNVMRLICFISVRFIKYVSK